MIGNANGPATVIVAGPFDVPAPGSRSPAPAYGFGTVFFFLSTLLPITPPSTPPTTPPITPPFTLSLLVVAPITAPAAAPMAASRFVCFSTTVRDDGVVPVLLLLPELTSPDDDVRVDELLRVRVVAVRPLVPVRTGATAAGAVPVRSSVETVSTGRAGVW